MDNNITFYYVDGISRSDTPIFVDLTSQTSYFNNKIVKVISQSFIPPFFGDKIKVEEDDITVNTNVNYLSIYYNDKLYYYFIDNIHFISSGVVELEIYMDVFQTFMFNIEVKGAVVNRKFINRWTEHHTYINRNYLRENVSSNLFQLEKSKSYSKTSDFSNGVLGIRGFILFKVAKDIWKPSGVTDKPVLLQLMTEKFTYFPLQYFYYIVPLLETPTGPAYISDITYRNTEDSVIATCNTKGTLRALCAEPNVIEILYLPFDSLDIKGDTYPYMEHSDYASDSVILRNCEVRTSTVYGVTVGAVKLADNAVIKINRLFDHFLNFDYSENSSKGVDFSYKYVPALIDENYYRVSFGEHSASATFPLYNSCSVNFTNYYSYDWQSGNRTFMIKPLVSVVTAEGNFYSFEDTYQVSLTTTNPIYLDLTTSTWVEWQAYNKASIASAFGGFVSKCFSFGLVDSYNVKNDLNELSNISQMAGSYITSNKGQADINKFSKDIKDTKVGSSSSTVSSTGGLIGTSTAMLNAWLGPSGSRATGNFINDLCSQSVQLNCSRYVCNNLNECAYYYHLNGYLVNEYIGDYKHLGGQTGLFSVLNNRYYFNILKMKSCTIHLSNYIESNNITDEIERRFKNGIRIWNTDSDIEIGNFDYDNVERSLL